MTHFHLRYNVGNKSKVRLDIRYNRENDAVRASGVTNAARYPGENGYYDVVPCDEQACEHRAEPRRPIVQWDRRRGE
jgi:hypothetical protein